MRQVRHEYDAFISHAVEDKIPIANELCARLEQAGLKIWYSGKELGVGDSIEKTIEKGLCRSRYGIVIFSPTYLAKNWTIREFYTLLAKEINSQKVILPVLYNITLDELKNKDLMMADRFAVSADKGLDVVVERLVKEIRKSKVTPRKVAWFSRIWMFLLFSVALNVVLLIHGLSLRSADDDIILPAADPAAANYFHAGTATALGEMTNLIRDFRGCSCENNRSDETTPAIQRSVFADNSPGKTRRSDPRAPQAHKMTMAVVFQIETVAEPKTTFSEDVSEVLDHVSPDGNDHAFIAVSDAREISLARAGCSRDSE